MVYKLDYTILIDMLKCSMYYTFSHSALVIRLRRADDLKKTLVLFMHKNLIIKVSMKTIISYFDIKDRISGKNNGLRLNFLCT